MKMKASLIIITLLSLLMPINSYSFSKDFAEKMIYELFDSHVDSKDRAFDENYFLKHMSKPENYGICIEEKFKSLTRETIADTELTSKDVEKFKTITIFKYDNKTHKKINAIEYNYSPYVYAGEAESITIYDLNLLGLKNNIKKDANEIKNFCLKIYKKYNKDIKNFKYEDLKNIEQYEINVPLGAFIYISVAYDKETNDVKNIVFAYSS